MDDSTRQGKTVVGVSRLAKKNGKPCAALVGVRTGQLDWLKEEGVSGVYPLFETPFVGEDPRKKDMARKLLGEVFKILSDFT